MVVCIVLQTLVVALVLRYLRNRQSKRRLEASFWEASRLLAAAMMILMLGNLLQIAVWACLFLQLAEFSDFQTAYYHSTVNFSTLGYGDIVMSPKRRLLGGLEAANGVLMFGLTTSTLYAVINALTGQILDKHRSRDTPVPLDAHEPAPGARPEVPCTNEHGRREPRPVDTPP